MPTPLLRNWTPSAHSSPRLWQPALRCALWISISTLLFACVTTEKTPAEPPRTHYVLEPAALEKAEDPMPDLLPIFVRVYAGDQLLERRLAYRAWDFNKDGNTDMLEYLNAQGQVVRRVYDLNRDGRVDVDSSQAVAGILPRSP